MTSGSLSCSLSLSLSGNICVVVVFFFLHFYIYLLDFGCVPEAAMLHYSTFAPVVEVIFRSVVGENQAP